jgi:predicted amidohydrolase YtcJ
MAIDAYEKAEQKNGIRDSRHKVSHIQLISSKDIPRMKKFGLIAALQPNWFYYDEKSSNISQTTLGKERADRMYSLKSLTTQGVVVAFGSDWPVGTNDVTMNPLDGIQTAVIRLPFTQSSEKRVYRPEERITIKEAVEAATIKGAYASFMENETGSLEKGKLADLIILDRDIIKGPSDEINKAKVVTTMLEGRVVYSSL